MYNHFKNKNWNRNQIEARLKYRNNSLPVILSLLTILISIIFYAFSQANSTLDQNHASVDNEINRAITIGLKKIEFLPQDQKEKNIDDLLKEITKLQNNIDKKFQKARDKNDSYFAKIVGPFGGLAAIILFLIIYQSAYTKTLLKLLDETKKDKDNIK